MLYVYGVNEGKIRLISPPTYTKQWLGGPSRVRSDSTNSTHPASPFIYLPIPIRRLSISPPNCARESGRTRS